MRLGRLVEAGARRRHFRLGAAAGRGRLVAGRRLVDRRVVARRRRHHLVAGRVVARLGLVGGGAGGRAPRAARHRVLVPGQDGPAVVAVRGEGGRGFFDDVVVVTVGWRRGEGVGGEGRPAEVSARRPAAPRAG